ncbi:hypothetical protein BA939_23725 [Rhizobium sp. S41]|nr:hypothetical protein BA939_23725 [Rhizobium sp. S41]KGE80390.1 hypothetical protein LW14_23210 [Rhizobium sp. H41]
MDMKRIWNYVTWDDVLLTAQQYEDDFAKRERRDPVEITKDTPITLKMLSALVSHPISGPYPDE